MNAETGKYLMMAGLLLTAVGAGIYFFSGKLHWIGHLPGDIRIERENFRFYFPVATMVLVSVVLTIVVNLIRKFLL